MDPQTEYDYQGKRHGGGCTSVILIAISLFCATCASAQILTAESGSILTADTRNIALGLSVGIENYKHDQANIGAVYKSYAGKSIVGLRIMGLIHFSDRFFMFNQGDAFFDKEAYPKMKEFNGKMIAVPPTSPRLEISAGVGIHVHGFKLMAGIQSDDYDPKTDNMKQPVLISKLIYNIKLK